MYGIIIIKVVHKVTLTFLMSHKIYLKVTSALFLIIAVLHALRLLYGWEAIIGGWMVPSWLSWIALVVALFLGYQGMKLAKK